MTPPTNRLSELRIERPDERESSGGFWKVLLLLLLLGGGAAGVWWWWKGPKPIPVKTAVVKEASSAAAASAAVSGGGGAGERTILNASGYVTARREATVSSKVTGKVVEVLVEEGMAVAEGQVLARLDDTNVQASRQLARAQLDSTTASLEETRVRRAEAMKEFQRQSDLLARRIGTQSEFDRAQATAQALSAKLRQQEADVRVAERTVDTWEQQVEDTVIRAPFAGIVTSKNAQPGEMISPMSAGGFTRTGICTIVDMQSLEIEIDVNESYINRVKSGQSVIATLDAYPEWRIPCKVIAIIPTADRQKSTVKVRVGFDKLEPRVLPEMSVKVAFQEAEPEPKAAAEAAEGGKGAKDKEAPKRLLTVPAGAVTSVDNREIVFVVRDRRAERRAVTVASRRTEDALLSAGVSAGERVVVDPPPELKDGMRVREVE